MTRPRTRARYFQHHGDVVVVQGGKVTDVRSPRAKLRGLMRLPGKYAAEVEVVRSEQAGFLEGLREKLRRSRRPIFASEEQGTVAPSDQGGE